MGIDIILLLLLQIGAILALSRVMGLLCTRLRQPQVMGEMIAGIMLGPSLFGLVAPHAWAAMFPTQTVEYLNVLSQVGVVFFLFLIGLDLDPKLIRNRGHAAVIISHASIFVPFVLGAAITLLLYRQLFSDTPAMRFSSVALFIGAAMSITAFPVLARILTERNLHKTKVGAIAITCAAVDDVTAWCMLAVVVGIARAHGINSGLITAVAAAVYIAIMFLVVRPFLKRLERLFETSGGLGQNLLAIVFLLVLASAYTTERIGIHALFGAFLMGAIMPKGTRFVRALMEKIEDFTVVFLLPIFFAYTGLRTQIGVLNSPELWFYTLLIIACACLGKFGGSTLAARMCGLDWREAGAIGALMNTRGLMELVILNVGLNLGVISVAVFSMMVIMALTTTALTTPVLHWVYPASLALESDAEESKAKSARRWFTVLLPVALPRSAIGLTRLAAALAPLPDEKGQAPGRRIIALHLVRPTDREFSSGLSDAESGENTELMQTVTDTAGTDVTVEPIAFMSRDIPSDIARVARVRGANLILMGYRKPVFGQAILGGTVHRVLTGSDCDVAIFVDRGYTADAPGQKILVPFLAGLHDRLALKLAGRIAAHSKAQLTVMHVVPPGRGADAHAQEARVAAERAFADPGQPLPVTFKVIEHASPGEAVVQESANFDLVVIGVEEQWGLESQLFGWRRERIAAECPKSLLIVRRHARLPFDQAPPPPARTETPSMVIPVDPVIAATAAIAAPAGKIEATSDKTASEKNP